MADAYAPAIFYIIKKNQKTLLPNRNLHYFCTFSNTNKIQQDGRKKGLTELYRTNHRERFVIRKSN